jgi:hypothetical protein
MRIRWWLLLAVSAAACSAAVLDRIVITVGRQAITESDLRKEILLASFLNQTQPDFSNASRKAAAKRRLDRALIAAEIRAGQYPAPPIEETEPAMESLKKSRGSSFQEALDRYGLTEQELRQYLQEQLTVLRFIDLRFGAAVQVVESEVREYYLRQFLPEWENKKVGSTPPSFDEVRDDLERIVRQQRADVLVEEWLKEAAGRTRIEYKDDTLR